MRKRPMVKIRSGGMYPGRQGQNGDLRGLVNSLLPFLAVRLPQVARQA